MHFRSRKDKKGKLSLDMTPMIDCVFNLLIFFALSFNFGVSPGIKVKLPKASADAMKQEKRETTVSITKDGKYYYEGHYLSIEDLRVEFNKLYDINPDAMVIVMGDEEALHGNVVTVMDAAKSAGLNKLAIATRPKDT